MPFRGNANDGRRLGRGTALAGSPRNYLRTRVASTYAHNDGTDRAPEKGYQDEVELPQTTEPR